MHYISKPLRRGGVFGRGCRGGTQSDVGQSPSSRHPSPEEFQRVRKRIGNEIMRHVIADRGASMAASCSPLWQVVMSELNGRTYYVDEVDEEKRPFKALLDVGIRSTSTGSVDFLCVFISKNR